MTNALDSYQVTEEEDANLTNIEQQDVTTKTWENSITKREMLSNTRRHPGVLLIDRCLAWFFFIELIIRFMVCPSKGKFLCNHYNVIDIVAILPRTLILLSFQTNIGVKYLFSQTWPLLYIKIAGLLRVVRLITISRHYMAARVFLTTIWESRKEIALLLTLYITGSAFFAAAVYFCEESNENDFPTMASGIWWALITMTTVGYGDSYPRTGLGKSIGVVCAFTGVIATALPVAVIATNYNAIYEIAKLQAKLRKLK